MKDFLSYVTDAVLTSGWENLHKYIIVFPQRRAALFMKDRIKRLMLEQKLQVPVVSPAFLTLDELEDCFTPLQPEDELHSVCRLHTIYGELTGTRLPLDVFYGWGRQLLSDFTNVDMSDIQDTDNFFSNTVAADHLETFQLDEELLSRLRLLVRSNRKEPLAQSQQAAFQKMWNALPAIYNAFNYADLSEEDRLSQQAYKGARMRDALSRLSQADSRCLEMLRGKTLVFAGFNYLLPAEYRLMDTLVALSRKADSDFSVQFFWDDWEGFRTNAAAFKYIRRHAEHFGNSLPAEAKMPGSPVLSIVTTPSPSSQTQFVGDWLKDAVKKGGRTAVIIADEAMLEPVVYALPDSISGQVNITKGMPLKTTRIYADVLRALKGKEMAAVDTPDATARLSAIHEALQSVKQEVVTKQEDEERLLLRSAMNQAARDTTSEEEAKTAEKQAAEALKGTWQWQLLWESFFQVRATLVRMESLIAEGTLSADNIDSARTLRNLIQRHLDTISIPFHGEPITDIQVIGVLETRLLDFDHILILNVEEGVVPSVSSDNSFIPYYLRKARNIQTGDEAAEVYAYNFFRLFHRAENVTMLFTADAQGQHAMSRFLMQILTSGEFPSVQRFRIAESASAGQKRPLALLRQPDWFNAQGELMQDDAPFLPSDRSVWQYLQDKARKDGRKTVSLSPSAINNFIACPRMFYLQNILGLQQLSAESQMLEVSEQGSLTHAALCAAYLDITGVRATEDAEKTSSVKMINRLVTPDMIQAFLDDEKRVDAAIRAAYDSINADWRKKNHKQDSSECHYLFEEHCMETAATERALRQVLAADAQESFFLCLMELWRDTPLSLQQGGQQVVVRTGGFIDRLDILHPETDHPVLRIVDYKTGRFENKKLQAESLESLFQPLSTHAYILQTLIYSLACRTDKANLLAGFLQFRKKQGMPISPDAVCIKPALLFIKNKKGNTDLAFLDESAAEDAESAKPALNKILDFEHQSVQLPDGSELPMAERFQALLSDKVQEILSQTAFPPAPKGSCYTYCPFFDLCNRQPPRQY